MLFITAARNKMIRTIERLNWHSGNQCVKPKTLLCSTLTSTNFRMANLSSWHARVLRSCGRRRTETAIPALRGVRLGFSRHRL